MRFRVFFPRDSKNPLKGVTEVVVEVGPVAVRECFEESGGNRARFIDCMADLIVNSLAAEWCRSMGVPNEKMQDCIETYSLNQGERIRENVEASIKKWIIETADLLKRCNKSRTCIMAALGGGGVSS
jgi:hypothetical protein